MSGQPWRVVRWVQGARPHWAVIAVLSALVLAQAFELHALRRSSEPCLELVTRPALLREPPAPTDDLWICGERFPYEPDQLRALTQGRALWLENFFETQGIAPAAQEEIRAVLLEHMRQVNTIVFREQLGFHGPDQTSTLLNGEDRILARALEGLVGPRVGILLASMPPAP